MRYGKVELLEGEIILEKHFINHHEGWYVLLGPSDSMQLADGIKGTDVVLTHGESSNETI